MSKVQFCNSSRRSDPGDAIIFPSSDRRNKQRHPGRLEEQPGLFKTVIDSYFQTLGQVLTLGKALALLLGETFIQEQSPRFGPFQEKLKVL
jgi:hypothetical protein